VHDKQEKLSYQICTAEAVLFVYGYGLNHQQLHSGGFDPTLQEGGINPAILQYNNILPYCNMFYHTHCIVIKNVAIYDIYCCVPNKLMLFVGSAAQNLILEALIDDLSIVFR